MAFVLFSAMRNEGPFLLDWVAYHRAIGFDRICIVTNDCTDGSYGLLKKLSDNGVIEHFDQTVPQDVSPQAAAVELVESHKCLNDMDWAIFLDADEYLNIKVGEGHVTDLVDYLSKRSLHGMLINWRLFGDSGKSFFSGSYISRDFTRCQNETVSTQFKTFFCVDNIATGFSPFLHRCRVSPGIGSLCDFITGSGERLAAKVKGQHARRHNHWLSVGDDTFALVSEPEIGYEIAQINHYIVRDPASFQLKKKRGRGHKPRRGVNNRHTDEFYNENNHNDAEDTTILRWQAKVQATTEELIQKCDIDDELRCIRAAYAHETGLENVILAAETSSKDFPLSFPKPVKAFVRETYENATAIIEYGSGGSTLLAAEIGAACVSVESDANWAQKLTDLLNRTHNQRPAVTVLYIDIGTTRDWGYPANNEKADKFWRYPLEVWDSEIVENVDTVLIDGRFRKACFVASLLNIKHDTRILFDDYVGRRSYHDVEKFIKPERTIGRMAEFIAKPNLITPDVFAQIIPWFADVR